VPDCCGVLFASLTRSQIATRVMASHGVAPSTASTAYKAVGGKLRLKGGIDL
jgi:hypothetical protein